MIQKRVYLYLIIITLLSSINGLFYPAISSTFGPYYGSIAKHIVITNNWNDLILSGRDWLDKPHLPFWLTAFSFKLFGINGFAFAISGFIFNLIGAIYTFKLARLLYGKEVAKLSFLFYLTTLHLMLSAIDVRAEAYLLGEIIPACFYSLLYYKDKKLKYALYCSIFIALSLMTKGIFTLITISSGLIVLWLYNKDWKNFINYRWYLILIASLLLTFPELLALYKQFDLQPDKLIFGKQNVSGIKWFFFDSQFGRFFNTGPIMSTNPEPFHWLYFVHTFLWAFLPWWPIFFIAVTQQIKNYKQLKEYDIYLYASFFITFILFSATKFQVDHYTNIIFPFAIIICAHYLINSNNRLILLSMNIISTIFFIIIIVLLTIIPLKLIIMYLILICFALYGYKFNTHFLEKLIYLPISLLAILFSIIMFINGNIYARYDAGYQAALYLNKIKNIQVIGYNVDKLSIDLYSNNRYNLINNKNLLDKNFKGYIFTKFNSYVDLKSLYPDLLIINDFYDCSIDKVIVRKFFRNNSFINCEKYIIIKIN